MLFCTINLWFIVIQEALPIIYFYIKTWDVGVVFNLTFGLIKKPFLTYWIDGWILGWYELEMEEGKIVILSIFTVIE